MSFLNISLLIGLILLLKINNHYCMIKDGEVLKVADKQIPHENAFKKNETVVSSIEKVETVGNSMEKAANDGILPLDETEKLYESMIQALNDIIDSVENVDNAQKFLNANGIERVIIPNLMSSYLQSKNRLLILLKVLFEVAPITTGSIIPVNVVDKLLDIFENNENLALKARALDVLNAWLPNNPIIQARVMKVKGLEPFYHQVSKLDVSVIKTLLELFSTILNEHVMARNEKIQKTKADLDRLRLYQRIGLIERMSTPTVCNGLLNIIEVALQYNAKDNTIFTTVFEIIKNIKPFCIRIYKGKKKAIELFDAILKHITDPDKEFMARNYSNAIEIQTIIQDYVENLKLPVKDEF